MPIKGGDDEQDEEHSLSACEYTALSLRALCTDLSDLLLLFSVRSTRRRWKECCHVELSRKIRDSREANIMPRKNSSDTLYKYKTSQSTSDNNK